ncbi:hypothetical protein PFTANZ_06323 [Plasmodium falciparum Tanzania (2000708)]|uniref:Duffy-binding-like domain-containing protein n=1 Tax=Plasmodium falciparum Tanzania (2000708) TaxID=1036725 RepID=A0A024VXC7_PLAFA|nr:hypothetical protein PFTANZ_06323 [Plasmodium falciparum Tanzania (2000708)]
MINTVSRASDDKDTMKKIQDKIQQILPKNGDKNPGQKSENPRDTWWNNNAKHIWNGMICALTYTEKKDTGESAKIKQDSGLKNALLDNDGKKPKKNGKYSDYEKVKLEDTSGPKINQSSSTSENKPTTLTNFISRPPYFRYLEEWGETFCGTQKRLLKDVKTNCLDENGGKKCSGDGEACDRTDILNEGLFAELYGSSCAISCRSYKKWISRKKEEFIKQENAYNNQKVNCETESKGAAPNNGDNGFCGTLGRCNTAAAFLNKLKSGPCKSENGEDKKGNSHITFDVNGETFRYEKYCGTCPEFKINCTKVKCTSGGMQNGCKDNKINAANFKTMGQPTEINMLVSDKSKNGSQNGLEDCISSGIFKGFREDVWECGNFCGYVVCKPKTSDGEKVSGKENGENQIILINALLKRWVEYFFEDYNKIRKKLNPCGNKSEKTICTNECLDTWISKKKGEWQQIKDRYKKLNKNKNDEDSNDLKNFLEQGIFESDKKKAIKPCGDLNAFENSCGLNGAHSSKTKGDDERDLVKQRR